VHPLARPPPVNPDLQAHSLVVRVQVDRAAQAAQLLLGVKLVARVALRVVVRVVHLAGLAVKVAPQVRRWPKQAARHPCAVASQPMRHRFLRVPTG
jgi:hypothetical protein